MAGEMTPVDISQMRLIQLTALIKAGREDLFYSWPEWHERRTEVLKLDHGECVRCRTRGRYRRAVLVHHVKHLTARPDLALSVFDPDTKERQLVSLCRGCHEEVHPERGWRKDFRRSEPLTEERWD